MARRSKDLIPSGKIPEIPEALDKSFRGHKLDTEEAIREEIIRQQTLLESRQLADKKAKEHGTGNNSFGNRKKQEEGEKTVALIQAGEIDSLEPKTPETIANDPELLELFESLCPDDFDIGISANRISRARLICKNLDSYSKEEKQLLVYPIVYQLHLYGYHRAEIAAILGTKPMTINIYIRECRHIYKDELIKEYTSEDRVAESLYLYDFVKKEALRRGAKASEDRAAAYLRLAAQVESERNKLLEATGYYEKIKRSNILEAIQDEDENSVKRNSILADIKEVFTSDVSDVEDL